MNHLTIAAGDADAAADEVRPDAPRKPSGTLWRRIWCNWAVRIGAAVLGAMLCVAIATPWLGTVDPMLFDTASRDLLPGATGEIVSETGDTVAHRFWMGSDALGRDIYSRVLYGTRISLAVGSACALLALSFGLLAGLGAGYFRWLEMPVMRVMDGIMAVPGVLVAIALVSLWSGSLTTVIIAVAIPEIPRVTRLVRSLMLSLREEPYVEAAISLGTGSLRIIVRHLLPNTVAPLIVQGTYICASAMLTEAALSFLGVGLPAEMPTWGNIMAEGRSQFQQYPHNVLFAGFFLAATVLAVNMLGDGLRDTLDPKMVKQP